MVYPDIKCWDNEGDIDSDGFNTNTGMLPTAIKAMIDRVTGGSGEVIDVESGPETEEGDDSGQGDSSRPPWTPPSDDERPPRPRPPIGGGDGSRPPRPGRPPRTDRPNRP